ncbi:MAG: hypothetical protein IKR40_06910 [Treponema sp.]|nr:hypothetical protein [Treponema sp.]
MLSKRLRTDIFSILFSCFALTCLHAQDAAAVSQDNAESIDLSSEEESDEINTWKSNSETNKISQPFAWESAGDVLKYEIIIYSLDENTGRVLEEVYRHETTEEENETCIIYFDPNLPPGLYRSKINVYNILGGLEEDVSTTDDFYIRQAYKPEVRGVSYPLFMRSIIYLDDLDNNGIVEVEGRNLFSPKENEEDLVFTDYTLRSNRKTIHPKSIISHDDKNNRKITLQFAMKDFAVEDYYMFAQDASGLHSEEGSEAAKLTVKFKKWLDIDVEAGYTVPIVLHDDTYKKYLDTRAIPLGGQARVTVVPLKYVWGYLGAGLRLNYSRLTALMDGYSVTGNMMNMHLLFCFQKPVMRRRIFLEPHIGAGLTVFSDIKFHFPHDIESPPLDTYCFSLDAGFTAQYYFNKRLYVEASLDYTLALNSDMMLGGISPSVGVGWQF